MLIGSLWVPGEQRADLKNTIDDLRKKHGIWGEKKWTKISPQSEAFYCDFVDMFFEAGPAVRFRSIVIDVGAVNMRHHGFDSELGFYKFYYQMLRHWIVPNQTYDIFTDLKTNKDRTRLRKLHEVLGNACPDSRIRAIQALPSDQVALLQLTDVLLGTIHHAFNGVTQSESKAHVVQRVEANLGHRIAPTWQSEQKFNVFKIHLGGTY